MAFMNLDQNAVSLQPAKFHAIPTLSPRCPLLAPLLILRYNFLHACCSRKACTIYSTSHLERALRDFHVVVKYVVDKARMFKPILKRLESTLDLLVLMVIEKG